MGQGRWRKACSFDGCDDHHDGDEDDGHRDRDTEMEMKMRW